jgi:asparagine synthetase B (glutamine-hydrolysing)
MCGILALLLKNNEDKSFIDFVLSELSDVINSRGPDATYERRQKIDYNDIIFRGYTLGFRGPLTSQPLVNENDLLIWNGEIFGGVEISTADNDGRILMRLLSSLSTDQEIASLLASIQGPWALVFWNNKQKKLWFARDMFGRRSLLLHCTSNGSIALSSVGHASLQPTCELPACGIFCYNTCSNNIICYPYGEKVALRSEMLFTVLRNISLEFACPIQAKGPKIFTLNETTPSESSLTILQRFEQKKLGLSADIFREVLSACDEFSSSCDQLTALLSEAVRVRVNCQNELCGMCLQEKYLQCRVTGSVIDATLEASPYIKHCHHARVAVLYSGGLDSLVLAALADKHVPEREPIDLLNVAFSDEYDYNGSSDAYSLLHIPDRATAISGLKQLNPRRTWNFVEINIGTAELKNLRDSHIRQLIFPLNTVLDESIGCAVWFAARGTGWLRSKRQMYTSTARVVLAGMGSDEQLAGYSRHLNSYNREGWSGLISEIRLDIMRISERNLGRDDRVIADHARESRYPYLDENVVAFLNSLPMWQKAYLSLPRGIGDKLLLRLCAYQLGLDACAAFPKRAIQFGSRIAHVEGTKRKGNDVSHNLSDNCD